MIAMANSLGFVFCLAAGLLVLSSNAAALKIRGVPGVDYPTYQSVPKTSFKCSEQRYIPGFYADEETDCQAFHFCYRNRGENFLCPVGTTFNQAVLACDAWHNSNCSLSSLFHAVNAGPGLREAGRNILRLRERAQGATLPYEPPASAQPKSEVSEQKVEEIAPVVPQAAADTIRIDHPSPDEPSVPQEAASDEAETPNNQFDSDQVLEEEDPNLESEEDENIPLGFPENAGSFDQFNPDSEEEMVFDTDLEEENRRQFHPDPEWKDQETEQFQNFYDPNQAAHVRQLPKDGLSHAHPIGHAPTTPSSGHMETLGEFSKRLAQEVHVPRRTRRKPTYVVLDKRPEYGHEMLFDPTTEIPPSTERPESISMDTLVELNTELPDGYSIVKDEQSYDDFEAREVEENVEAGEADESYFDQDGGELVDYSDQDRYEGEDRSDQYYVDHTPEYLEPSDDIQQEYMQGSFPESGDINSVDEMEDTTDDDILVYDDSNNPQVPEMEPESPQSESSEKFVVIPKEDDDLSTEASYEAATEDGFEGDGSEPSEIEDEDIYVVNDEAEGQPGYGYPGMQGESDDRAYFDPQAQGDGYGPYGMSRGLPGAGYGYQHPTGEMDYSQYQGQDYNFGQYQGHPGSYYQYVDEYGRPLNPQYVDPTIQQMPEDPTRENEPDGIYQHGVYGDSYPIENMQQGTQPEESEGQYVYNPELGLYQGPDGRFYTPDGVEVQPQVAPDGTEDADWREQSEQEFQQFQEYPEQQEMEEFSHDPEESEIGDSHVPEDLGDSDHESDEFIEGEAEESDDDLASSGLVKDFREEEKIATSAHLDEGGEAESLEHLDGSEIVDESLDFDGTPVEDEHPEEIIAEGKATADNHSEPVHASKDADGASDDFFGTSDVGDEKLELPVPEKPAVHVQEPDKSGDAQPDLVNDWSSQPGSIDFMNPVPDVPSEAVDFMNPVPDVASGTIDFMNPEPPVVSPQMNGFSSGNLGSTPEIPVPMAPTENQFMNVPFQTPMDFGPYGFGPNMRQQFGMLDSSNQPFTSAGSKVSKVRDRPAKSGQFGDGKLSSLGLSERMKFMKRGKFGMFKKYMNSMNV